MSTVPANEPRESVATTAAFTPGPGHTGPGSEATVTARLQGPGTPGGRAWHFPVRRPRSDALTGWSFALPALVLLAVFVLYPLIDTVVLSFTNDNGLSSPQFVGLSNYRLLLSDPVFRKTLVNSFIMTGSATVLLVTLPMVAAYWIHRRIPFARFFRSVLYLPVTIPIIVAAVAFKWLLDDHGLLNYVLESAGLISKPISWLGDPRFAIWSVVIVIFWRAFGIYLLIYLAGFSTIMEEIFEAAAIDGAGHFATFTRVVVPNMRNSISLATVVSFVASMRLFDEVYVMTGGGPLNSSKNTAYYIWESAFSYFKFGYASAMAVVLLAIVLLLVTLGLRLAKRGEA